MVLPNIPKEMEKAHRGLGGVGEACIPRYVELAKGRAYDHLARRFYQGLVNESRYMGSPLDVFEAQEKLRSAWWVEDEDVTQFLYSVLLRFPFNDARTVRFLGYSLTKYLFTQRVFSRQIEWEKLYPIMDESHELEERLPRPYVLFDERIKLPTYDRYLLYCVSMGYTISQLAILINQDRRQVYNELARLRKEIPCLFLEPEPRRTKQN